MIFIKQCMEYTLLMNLFYFDRCTTNYVSETFRYTYIHISGIGNTLMVCIRTLLAKTKCRE